MIGLACIIALTCDDHAAMVAIAEPWRPYRTLASAYLFAASSAKRTLDRMEP
jgi:3-methyladenine DNA glycosylase/8-oxoguanine DNA glycosylase